MMVFFGKVFYFFGFLMHFFGIKFFYVFLGRDLIGVHNLIKKHQALITEIHNHEPQINYVVQNAEATASGKNF